MILFFRRAVHTLSALLMVAFLSLGGSIAPAQAEQIDVAAAVRGVVRVVIIATNGQDAYFVGHGSGFAVAPDKVLTNAHVVELLRTEKNLVVGIIPSQGKKSYGGKVIAYSPGNDLALIQLKEGRLPVSTFFAGAVSDGQHVTAIGYPGAVDRAQGLDLEEMIQPLSPVKTSGTVSMGRASHGFDTLLHTAPMAQGNSGGPLVDDCGRVLGVNSFGSQSESDADAEFGFAISNREVTSFLRQAGVSFQRTSVMCRSIAELDAEEARRTAADETHRLEAERAQAEAREKALQKARDQAEQDIYSARENAVAVAGVLLVLSGLALGATMMFHAQGKERERLYAGVAGGLLLIGAALTFFLRPSFADIDDRLGQSGLENMITPVETTSSSLSGDLNCKIDESRSRITVSGLEDVALRWTQNGCVNGDTQYGPEGTGWSRILVPNSEDAISIHSFDPTTRTYKVDRYLADEDILAQARQMREHYGFRGCTSDTSALDKLQQMQREIRAVLPPQPNERLVYSCGTVEAGAQANEQPAR